MPFGLWVQTGQRNHKLDGLPDPPMESSNFGGHIYAPFEYDCTAMRPYVKLLWLLVVAALRSRCGHCILPLSYHFLLSFFPCLFSVVTDWMSAVLPHMMWSLCEFRMQVCTVLHAARWKYRTQKLRKKIAICAPSHNFVGPYLRN